MELEKERNRAKNNAYSLLRSRPRSEFEIRERLKIKGYGDSIIDDVMESLKKSRDIDDQKFARYWADSRMHLNPVGDVILRHELKEKGIAEPLIEATLEAKDKSYDEYEVAFSMARERFERLKKFDRKKSMKRLYDFLVRRGFKYENVQKIIEELSSKG